MRVCKYIALARILAVSCLITTASGLVINPAKAEGSSFAQETSKSNDIPILNRFELSSDYGQVAGDEQGQVLMAYQKGLVTEDELSKFYPAKLDKEKIQANWKKISFAMAEDEDEKVYIDLRPKDKALTLRYSLKFNK